MSSQTVGIQSRPRRLHALIAVQEEEPGDDGDTNDSGKQLNHSESMNSRCKCSSVRIL